MNPETRRALENDRTLEAVTLESEISMSIAATDDTRDPRRRRGLLFGRSITHPIASTVPGVDQTDDMNYCNAGTTRRCAVNVEPVIFIFAITFGLMLTIQPLFLYWARCIEIFADSGNSSASNINNVSYLCARLSDPNNSFYQDIVEKDIASTKILLQIASGVPTLLTAPVIGAWSDGSGGRRRPLLLSLFGLLMYSLCQFGSTLSYKWINVYSMQYLAELMIGCAGGIATVFMASFAIVTDDSRHQMLPGSTSVPLRIGIASALQSAGLVVGNSIASIFTVSPLISIEAHESGYIKATAIACGFAFAALLYAFVCVRETHQNPHLHLHGVGELSNRRLMSNVISTETPQGTGSRNCWKYVKLFIYDITEVIVERRPGWTRFCLNLSLCFVFVEFLAIDNQLLFLLVKRYPLEWSDTTFAYFSLYKNIVYSLGMIIIPFIVSKGSCLGKDSLLIVIGVLASCVQFLMYSIANDSVFLFIAGGFSFLAGAIAPGYRSFLPRLVAKEETARLFTLFSIVTVFCPIFSALLFNNIFNATIDLWPGLAFLVGAFFQMVVFMGQIIIHCLLWTQWNIEHEGALHQRLNTNDDDYMDDAPRSPIVLDTGRDQTMSRSLSNTAIHSANGSPEGSYDALTPLLT